MRTCDMFCRVIDNYGDAGVSWRLAQMLAKEYNWAVRLIIDDAAVLSAIVPTAQTKATPAVPGQVVVSDWLDDSTDTPFASWSGQAADVVIELFSCRLPDVYEAAIAKRVESSPCAVFALDYLTAEKYAEEGNGLPSPHPRYGYDKTFLFPGFPIKPAASTASAICCRNFPENVVQACGPGFLHRSVRIQVTPLRFISSRIRKCPWKVLPICLLRIRALFKSLLLRALPPLA